MKTLIGVVALLMAFAQPAAAEGVDGKKALKEVDKAVVRGVDALGAAFKQASREIDRAAKAGSERLRETGKKKEE